MQRYRVNYRLLGILVVSSITTCGVAYGVWLYQINDNADNLFSRAERTEGEGRLIDARNALIQYVSLRPDDYDARKRLAILAKKIFDEGNASDYDRAKAYEIIVTTVRETNDPELRRMLADMYISWGRFQDALVQIDELLLESPDDPELKALQARCLFAAKDYDQAVQLAYELIGYNRVEDQFDLEQAKGADQVEIYALLTSHLRTLDGKDELADRVIAQMVEVNADSADAQLQHYLVQMRDVEDAEAKSAAEYESLKRDAERAGEAEKRDAMLAEAEAIKEADDAEATAAKEVATQSLEKAYQLDPENEAVLLQKGLAALRNDETETALDFFRRGKEAAPENPIFIYQIAMVHLADENKEKALEALDEGLESFELLRVMGLSNLKVNLLLEDRNFEAVEEQVKNLRRLKYPAATALADFHEARILFYQDQWVKASHALQSVWRRLSGFRDLETIAGTMLAICQRKLGRPDVALLTYNSVLDRAPEYEPAIQGRAEVVRQVGRTTEGMPMTELGRRVSEMLRKPPAEREWQSIQDYIDRIVEDRGLHASRRLLLEAQVALLRKEFSTAEGKIREAFALNPEDLTTRLAAVRLLQNWPGKGPAIALKLLDQIVADDRFEDNYNLRSMRADLLVAAKPDNLVPQLMAVTDGIGDWPASHQAQVWSSVGTRLLQAGQYDESWTCIEKAIELVPDNPKARVFLFEVALSKQDNALMQEAQARLLEFLEDESDPDYVLTEVKRRMVQFAAREVSREELIEARKMLDQAIDRRDSWHELYIARGQLAIMLDGDIKAALRDFDEALQSGPAVTNAVVLQTRLLTQFGQFDDALRTMERLPADTRTELLGKTEAEVLLRVGKIDEAFKSAQLLAETKRDDAGLQVWYGDIARRAKRYDVAEDAMRRGLAIRGDVPDYWSQLITLYSEMKDGEKVFAALRDAALALDAEHLPLLTAKTYELQGRWQSAEEVYLKVYEPQLTEPRIARLMAEFYLRWEKSDADNVGKASIHLNNVLRAVADGRIPPTDANAMWARRRAARILATSGDYRDTIKAEKMLREAMELAADKEQLAGQLADVLSSRGDPASRLEAVQIFQQLKDERGLTKSGDLRLGRLLFDVGEWLRCKNHMLDVVSRYPQDPQIRSTFVDYLLTRREFSLARRQLASLREIETAQSLIVEYEARLAAAEGKTAEVRRRLEALTPNPARLADNKVQVLLGIAALAERVEDYEYAETVLNAYLARRPDESIHLARLIAVHGDPQRGIKLLEEEFSDNMDQVLRFSVQMLRKRRPEVGDALDASVDKLLTVALRDDPDSASRLILRAEVYEIQEKFDEAVAAYENVLKRDDLPPLLRAAGNNNLAYLLALTGDSYDRALTLVNEAIEMIGPVSDVLDTRAVVHIARGRGEEAAADMRMAVRTQATAMKYFHLAQAELMVENPKAAALAWEEALAEGLEEQNVSPLEKRAYLDVKQQIDEL